MNTPTEAAIQDEISNLHRFLDAHYELIQDCNAPASNCAPSILYALESLQRIKSHLGMELDCNEG